MPRLAAVHIVYEQLQFFFVGGWAKCLCTARSLLFTYLFYLGGEICFNLKFFFSVLSLLRPAVHIDMRLEDEFLSS